MRQSPPPHTTTTGPSRSFLFGRFAPSAALLVIDDNWRPPDSQERQPERWRTASEDVPVARVAVVRPVAEHHAIVGPEQRRRGNQTVTPVGAGPGELFPSDVAGGQHSVLLVPDGRGTRQMGVQVRTTGTG